MSVACWLLGLLSRSLVLSSMLCRWFVVCRMFDMVSLFSDVRGDDEFCFIWVLVCLLF